MENVGTWSWASGFDQGRERLPWVVVRAWLMFSLMGFGENGWSRRFHQDTCSLKDGRSGGFLIHVHVVHSSSSHDQVVSELGYDHWSIMMKTLFRFNGLWEVVEKGFSKEEAKLTENQQKDAHALFLIQQAVHRSLFSRIAAANTAKEAWDSLKIQFQGSPKIKALRIQALRQAFESLQRKEDEGVQAYIARVNDLVNQMKGLGDEMPEALAVGKVLRTLGPKYNFVVAAIGEAKDLTKLTMDELAGSLQAHEALLLSQDDTVTDKALVMKEDSFDDENWSSTRSRGRGLDMYNLIAGSKIKFLKTSMWREDQVLVNLKNPQTPNKDIGGLFMVHTENEACEPSIWLVDSGCSCHMSRQKELFYTLDESDCHKVRLVDDQEVNVAGKRLDSPQFMEEKLN
ncbi:uncharacterized protein LOC120251274 [Dioscorea cayenensis subsp. rotundata]|uniref:Uncharacterized protein LOC120251274 n=1 Tax=Dioscorea cayennensis subsp. rotundata TaxID=55577 RepID=A0AB40AL73_DIOCR|nr:uncharacterized protein LOC120251274 [Dioscorea cayenensis subsp. rotundata]